MSRLSRKQIKRDEVIETVSSVVQYSRAHRRGLLLGVIALVAVLVLAAGALLWRQQRSARAHVLLAEAMEALGDDSSPGQEEVARELFGELVSGYSGSPAADVARLYLGGFAAADGDEEEARQLWEQTARRRAGSALAVQARLNLLALGREQDRHEELAGELRSRLQEGDDTLPSDHLLYQLGLTLEAAGSDAEARDAYDRLVDEHPLSPLRGAAEARAERLGGAEAVR